MTLEQKAMYELNYKSVFVAIEVRSPNVRSRKSVTDSGVIRGFGHMEKQSPKPSSSCFTHCCRRRTCLTNVFSAYIVAET